MNSIAQSTKVTSKIDKTKLAYYGFTGLLSLLMSLSIGMYIFNNAEMQTVFLGLGFPVFIIYPLALAKTLGLIAIWSRKSSTLLNLAYAGFFYDFILAFGAHVAISDGEFPGAVMALVLLAGSYFSQKKHFAS
jgi:hypothetical protein